MRTKKERQPDNILYICETCKRESSSKGYIESCEKRHTCKHEPSYELNEASEDSWWFQVNGINCICKFCKKELGFADFETVENETIILNRIYDIVKENEKGK